MKSDVISCVVIGAGPGGIVATKELLENGFEDVICLEKTNAVGGVFASSYDNLILTSSVTFSMFSDFWVGDGRDNDFWTKEEAVKYWEDYATHNDVLERIKFNAEVKQVRLEQELWEIQLHKGDVIHANRLVLAIGNNNIPKFPDWKNQITEVKYSHSKDYRNADAYKGKNVLVVGGGESGSDVAYEISKVANSCYVSLRETTGWIVPRRRGEHAADVSTHRGLWDLPRDYGAILSPFVLKLERGRQDPVFDALADLNEKVSSKYGIWGIFGTKTLALPKAIANHGCKVIGDIVQVAEGGLKLTSADGVTLENIDEVIFSTGYHNEAKFMPEELQACDPRKLYKHIFNTQLKDKIAWIGWARPAFGSQFPIMEMQSRFMSLIFSGKMKLPSNEQMDVEIENDMAHYFNQFEGNAKRIRSLIDYHHYMNTMAKMIGCFPPLIKYFFTQPKLWFHLMYGPTQATQFRLRGPGKKIKKASDIIYKLPISTYNHIVKAGLRGRLRYGLKSLVPRF
jgi:dimethylaniline monooxygenase (N-oxide forming)